MISVDTLADGFLQSWGGGGSREETGFVSLPTCFSDGSVYLYQRAFVQCTYRVCEGISWDTLTKRQLFMLEDENNQRDFKIYSQRSGYFLTVH
jgi:hypothetical protein